MKLDETYVFLVPLGHHDFLALCWWVLVFDLLDLSCVAVAHFKL